MGSRDEADWGEYPDIDTKFLASRYASGGGDAHNDGTRTKQGARPLVSTSECQPPATAEVEPKGVEPSTS